MLQSEILIDTHAHIYTHQFENDSSSMLLNAFNQGVSKIFMPNIDLKSIENMLAIEKKYPENCFAMMGLHPCSVAADFENTLQILKNQLDERNFVAVGEIGLDFYWSLDFVAAQEKAFEIQVNWAIEKNIPIIIHCRESLDRTLQVLEPLLNSKLTGIFHCFTGSLAQAEKIIEMGFLLGIGGVVTYKNGGLDKVLPHIGLEHLVLETDSPYLPPVPHRGKRNEPAYLPFIAKRIADLKGIDFQTVAQQTTENALKLFGMN
ncbi:MAG: TatD family hydrolase [Verrucomicrobia bacterium]|nr:TatD family hydrolase [Cytophagales bacterium]